MEDIKEGATGDTSNYRNIDGRCQMVDGRNRYQMADIRY